MAASAPPPNLAANWIDSKSSDMGTNSLEMRLSGMNLMSSFTDTAIPLSSTILTYSPRVNQTNNDNSQQYSDKGMVKTSGLGALLPSPIPFAPSSLRGDANAYSNMKVNYQSDSSVGGLANYSATGFDGFNSFRPMTDSQSQKDNRGGSSALETMQLRTVLIDGNARSNPNSRPPLSGATESAPTKLPPSDTAAASTPSTNQLYHESEQDRWFGVISRPNELGNHFAHPPHRRMSIATESGREFLHGVGADQNMIMAASQDHSIPHKYGTMSSTFSPQLQQQRQPRRSSYVQPGQQQRLNHMNHIYAPLQPSQPMHSFSAGANGVPNQAAAMYENLSRVHLTSGIDNSGHSMRSNLQDYNSHLPTNQHYAHQGYPLSGDSLKAGPYRRRSSISHAPSLSIPSRTDSNGVSLLQRRNSQPNMGTAQGYYGHSIQGHHHTMPQMDSRDFSSQRSPIVASLEELIPGVAGQEPKSYSRHDKFVPPIPSPSFVHYGGSHNLPPNDRTSSSSTSHMSLNNAMMGQDQLSFEANHYGQHSHHHNASVEDHSRSFAGDHIDMPVNYSIEGSLHRGYAAHPGPGGYMIGDNRAGNQLIPNMLSQQSIDNMSQHYTGFDSTNHLPTAGATLPSPKVVYNVKFKRTQRSFVLGPRSTRDLKIGTYVKVEADRGEDLGIVVGKIPAEKYSIPGRRPSFHSNSLSDSAPSANNNSAPHGAADLKCVIRLATHDEVSLLLIKRDEEEALLKICSDKVRHRGLPMNIVDAEYQFDRHKLTFFFEAEGRVDFRELVRDLFSIYKTRIWMQQLDKSVTCNEGSSGMAMGLPIANAIDYGTPIIAPASEFTDSLSLNEPANEGRSD